MPMSAAARRACLLALAALTVSRPASAAFVTFESGQVRPLSLSPDQSTLFAVNTPDNRLEVFDVTPGGDLVHAASVPVGLEPVAVAARTNTEVWVVNHLSDSVSIVDLAGTPRVVRTLLTCDEPRDIVFAGPGGTKAFITTARRGQSCVGAGGVPVDPKLTVEGTERALVQVFDATNLGSALGGTPRAAVELFGDTPRALAVSADGNTVYAAVFQSGNRTTTLSEGVVCNGGSGAGPCNVGGFTMPGGLPAPNPNSCLGEAQPETGMIVKFNPASGHWVDTLARNWDNGVRFTLPDKDVFAIDAAVDPPVATGTSWAGVGTILFDMVVNPSNGKIYVSNTDANNLTRFEGDRTGSCTTSTVRGHLHEARITVLDGATVLPRHLNKHLEPYDFTPTAADRAKSLATPVGMAVAGTTLYVAAFGSSQVGIFDTAQLEANSFTPSAADHITVSGGGPSGLLLRGSRLYVFTRFDNAISVIDTTTRTELAHLPVFNPEPASVVDGRPFLYDAAFTSANGEASCAACHVFGDFDSLAWDLGDPDIATLNNPSFLEVDLGTNPDFRALKGPMTTQSLRGMANHGPMHWRGDRTGGNDPGGDPLDEEAAFKKFNVAFPGLLGRSGELTAAEMQAFTDFILQVTYPPNPIRALDNSLSGAEQAGFDTFVGPVTDTFKTCNGCHRLDPSLGFFGTGGNASFENEPQIFKIPHLRNLYQKVGMFGMPQVAFFAAGNNGATGDQVRGFGFLHDGSVDTLFRFHGATVFTLTTQQRQDLETFMLAFDSNLAPIVGQQTTLTSGNAAQAGPRIDLLIQRAATTPPECDVVVKGAIAGEPRGWVRLAGGQFRSDDSTEPLLSDAALRAFAGAAGQELTYTCAPPGSGTRIGIDRDEDACLDREDPAPDDPLVVCGAATTTTTTTTPGTTTTSTTVPATSGQPVLTTRLVLKDDPADATKRRLKLVARDPAVTLGGGNGSGDDPVLFGAVAVASSTAASFAGSYALPATGWQYIGPVGSDAGYKYRDPKGLNGPVIRAVVKAGKLVKVVAKGPDLELALGTNPDPAIVRLAIGSLVYCAEAGGTVTFTAPKVYVAQGAAPPATCP